MIEKLMKSRTGKMLGVGLGIGASIGAAAVFATEKTDAKKAIHFVLQAKRVVTIDARTLASRDTPDSTIYEISGGELFATSPKKARQLVAAVHEAERNRLVADHVTILIAADSLAATVVRTEAKSISVTSTTILSRTE
jgi:hypothetical protein